MAKRTGKKSTETQAAIEELDRVFHEKARLGIMTTMVGASDGLNFNEYYIYLGMITDPVFCSCRNKNALVNG